MLTKIYCKRITEIKREKRFLERKLKVKISVNGRVITIECEPIEEYEAGLVFEAINLGFSAQTASLLTEGDYLFEKINIKDYTRRKNLDVIRSRLIGTHGGTKKTIEQISGCGIVIKDNIVGIIGPAESVEYALTAVTNIIRGTKQTNTYKYLERINTGKKSRED